MNSLRSLSLALLAFLLTGCAESRQTTEVNPTPHQAFREIEWQLVSFQLDNEPVTIPETATVTFNIDQKDAVSGNAAVNRYNGKVVIDDEGSCQWDAAIATTRMAGPPELMTLEHSFTTALPTTSKLTVSSDGESLSLANEDGTTTLVFSKSAVQDEPGEEP